MKKTYTKEQVYQVFKREAVLIGSADAVPAKRAAFYFSKKALDFAKSLGKHKASSAFGIGDRCSLYEYFTLYGLELAATSTISACFSTKRKPSNTDVHKNGGLLLTTG